MIEAMLFMPLMVGAQSGYLDPPSGIAPSPGAL
jgi:hypothetical protein